MDQIKERIECLLKSQFLTIKDLEVKAGLKEKTVWYFLRGKTQVPKIDTLVAISKALNCSLEEIVFGKKDVITLSSKKSKLLFDSSLKRIMNFLKGCDVEASTDEIFKSSIELYMYCLESDLSEIDEKFAEYLLKKNFPSTQ
jgi:transcriptional regulator with XRE-family HTH domain